MDRSELETRCNALRLELKAWEKAFAAEHEGRKAGREDIKADATISAKYKEYNKLRDILSGRSQPRTPSKRTATRKPASDGEKTPKAQQKSLNATPLKRKRDSGVSFGELTEVNENLSPQGPDMIGPTPQRDGIVLGLFDLLPTETPSKRRAVLAEVAPNVLQTPSRNLEVPESETSLPPGRGERTPQSIGKRNLLDRFVTPQKRKRGEEGTPTSALKGLATPAFLRRDAALDVIIEDDEPTPRPAPWKRRGLGRSLSSMIQSLKKQEEDRLDEEAEIMREMEMEAEGIVVPRKSNAPEVVVEDSQQAMPLGPDGAVDSEDEGNQENDDAQGPDGQPRKVWKKRGQKRQTRRVIMRPNFVKPLPVAPLQDVHSSEEDAVLETQLDGFHEDTGTDDDGSDYDSDASHTPKKRKTQPKQSQVAGKQESSVMEPVKKVARKIKATAHANYRKLKIKSKGAGNGGKRHDIICDIVTFRLSAASSLAENNGCVRPLKDRNEFQLKAMAYIRNRIFEGYSSTWTTPRYNLTPIAKQPCDEAPTSRAVRASPSTSKRSPRALQSRTTTISPATTALPVISLTTTAFDNDRTSIPLVISTAINPTMAEGEIHSLIKQLHQSLQTHNYDSAPSLLSRAKVALLSLKALIPTEKTPRHHLQLARETLELGAILSIRLKDPVAFTRYFQQLQPFYSLPPSALPREGSQASKITGLYLLLLLSDGDYAGFHTLLETLEMNAAQEGRRLEDDRYVQYPVRLEQALMEGAYDKVWGETKGERVPGEEFALFSDVLINTIRKEIASCSEKAYPSIPISDAKSHLFLDSEGAVVNFAQECGWDVKDGRIYFPQQEEEYGAAGRDVLGSSDQVIEHTLGYARELETIV
ncbi:uncharacterized protein EI97DRAFT_382413 [Westerdykella ornata]|uniref:DNA replication regulator SLD2 n=1 Tax=Westerdykella ornata TaxID=318751 RepID=A0A6A6JCC3_WESOR|nr:uncharacterized protein EI97DRAFT_382413 [Westerdykella ornata]KAF2273917.1 hypothetical protein EI97DRAFT_382413 [Westerdykella ornata]